MRSRILSVGPCPSTGQEVTAIRFRKTRTGKNPAVGFGETFRRPLPYRLSVCRQAQGKGRPWHVTTGENAL